MHPQVEKLLLQPQPEQRTKEWYEARQTRITASSVSSLLTRNETVCGEYVEKYDLSDIFSYDEKSCNKYSSKEQFILDKCRSNFSSSEATTWGNKYESIALDLYSLHNNNVKLIEFGLISHDSIPWLAASPDSITEDGVMVEIKCPYKRKISGIPLLSYYQQVQIQLEVCDLEVCDFAEYEFQEVKSLQEFIKIEYNTEGEPKDRGIFIQIENIPDTFENRKYYYPDKSIINDVQELIQWAQNKVEEFIEENNLQIISSSESKCVCVDRNHKKLCIRTIYWKVELQSVVRIHRSRKWFSDVKPILKQGWDEVVHYRDNVYPYRKEDETIKKNKTEVQLESMF